ncbi:MAG: hypothetical protein C5B55_04430 [Blastocatellia bacterium]|nr:MAG: hypothetical protein C5B55_04430 [Blastocatellia bacterium]
MTPRKLYEIVLSVGAPLVLAVLELFHPRPHDLFHMDLHKWMLVHYLQIPLFPLSAYAVVLLVRAAPGVAACIARVAMFVFGITYVAFDTAAGLVTGVLLQAAQTDATTQWQPAVMRVWTHPVLGGAPGTTPVLAVVGTMAWTIGGLAATWIVWRRKGSWLAGIFLLISALALFIFKTHAWPGGPITFGALAAAAICFEVQRGDQT